MSPQRKIKVLFLEKVNYRYKRTTKSKQASGLTNCINHIVSSFDAAVRVEVDNYDHVFAAIEKYNPEKVVFEALFAREEWIQKLKKSHPSLKCYTHLHSNIPFLATEGISFHAIKELIRAGCGLIFNDARARYAFGHLTECEYLPNIYAQDMMEPLDDRRDGFLDVACYGSIRPMKNQVMQAIAACIFANEKNLTLRFHMNLSRIEGGDDTSAALKGVFMNFTNHQLIYEPWREQKDFIEHLRKMDLGMQVSMSETFNLVAADYVAAGIPIVVSDEIHWANYMCKSDPGSCQNIVRTIENSLSNPNLIKVNQMNLMAESARAISSWSDFINGNLE